MNNTKFKVGDKVRVIKKSGVGSNYYYDKIAVITQTDFESMTGKLGYEIRINENPNPDGFVWFDEELELIEHAPFTKSDLKDGMVVERKDGARRIVLNSVLTYVDGWLSLVDYNDDLTFKGPRVTGPEEDFNIVKVYKSDGTSLKRWCDDAHLTLIWERKEEPDHKEMTVEQIEEKLGYKVKIVGENK